MPKSHPAPRSFALFRWRADHLGSSWETLIDAETAAARDATDGHHSLPSRFTKRRRDDGFGTMTTTHYARCLFCKGEAEIIREDGLFFFNDASPVFIARCPANPRYPEEQSSSG